MSKKPHSQPPVIEPSAITGYIDYLDWQNAVIAGWVWHRDAPNERLTVHLLIDGILAVSFQASDFRADVQAAGYGDGRYGFTIQLPENLRNGAEHSIDISLPTHPKFHFHGYPLRTLLGPLQAEIRPPTFGDVTALAQFWGTHLLSDDQTADHQLAISEHAIRTTLAQPTDFILNIVQANDRIVGFSVLERKANAGYRHAACLRIALLPLYRGKGLGGKLLDATLARARQLELRRIELTVNVGNCEAIGLYVSRGFEQEGTLRDAYLSEGSFSDELMMSLILEPLTP